MSQPKLGSRFQLCGKDGVFFFMTLIDNKSCRNWFIIFGFPPSGKKEGEDGRKRYQRN